MRKRRRRVEENLRTCGKLKLTHRRTLLAERIGPRKVLFMCACALRVVCSTSQLHNT